MNASKVDKRTRKIKVSSKTFKPQFSLNFELALAFGEGSTRKDPKVKAAKKWIIIIPYMPGGWQENTDTAAQTILAGSRRTESDATKAKKMCYCAFSHYIT